MIRLLLAAAAPLFIATGTAHAASHPLVVGDSVTVAARSELRHYGWSVDAHGSRSMAAGIDVLRRRRWLPRVVVVALGSNGDVTRADLDALERLTGPSRVLVLVTPRELGGSESQDARLMRERARRHPGRVRLLDWSRQSRGRDYFWGDGLHLKPAGARAFARMIRPARLWQAHCQEASG